MSITTRIATRRALGALAIAVTASAAQGQRADERAIRALSDQWQRDIAAQNVDAIVALHTSDAVVMMSHAPVARGSAAIRGIWSEAVKTPGLNLSWTPTKIEVVSPTRAIEYGNYTESYDTPQGKGTDAGSYITVWHKVAGKWRIAADAPVTSQALPAAPSDAAGAEMASVKTHAGNALAWTDFTPPGFDPGKLFSVLA